MPLTRSPQLRLVKVGDCMNAKKAKTSARKRSGRNVVTVPERWLHVINIARQLEGGLGQEEFMDRLLRETRLAELAKTLKVEV